MRGDRRVATPIRHDGERSACSSTTRRCGCGRSCSRRSAPPPGSRSPTSGARDGRARRGAEPGPDRRGAGPDDPRRPRRDLPRRPRPTTPSLARPAAGAADRPKRPRRPAARARAARAREHRAGARARAERDRVRARGRRRPPLEGVADGAERRERGGHDRPRLHRAAPGPGGAPPARRRAGGAPAGRDARRGRRAARAGLPDGDGGGLRAARPALGADAALPRGRATATIVGKFGEPTDDFLLGTRRRARRRARRFACCAPARPSASTTARSRASSRARMRGLGYRASVGVPISVAGAVLGRAVAGDARRATSCPPRPSAGCRSSPSSSPSPLSSAQARDELAASRLPHRRGRRRRAPPDRAQPPRRRPAAARRALRWACASRRGRCASDPAQADELLAAARRGARRGARGAARAGAGHPSGGADRPRPRRRGRGARRADAAPGRARRCGCPSACPSAVEAAAYYVVSEALANVVKHARSVRGDASASRARDGARAGRGRGRRRRRGRPAGRLGPARPARPRRDARRAAERRERRPAAAPACGRRSRCSDDCAPCRRRLALLREGLARLLEEAGIEVVGQAGDADELMLKVRSYDPTSRSSTSACRRRRPTRASGPRARSAPAHPETGVLVLSQYVAHAYAVELLGESAEGLGYLLKDRVADVDEFAAAVRRVGRRGLRARPARRLRARRPQPRRRPARAALGARARGARADGRGPHELRDRAAALHLAAGGREARHPHLHQARPPRRPATTTAACSPSCASSAPSRRTVRTRNAKAGMSLCARTSSVCRTCASRIRAGRARLGAGSLDGVRTSERSDGMSVPVSPLTERARFDRRRWIALAVIATAQFMVVLDVAIVNVALPTIKTDLHFSQESLQWVVTAYAILFGGVLLLGGRMADLLGRRRLFMAGPGAVHRELAARRPRLVGGLADRLPRAAGARRRVALAGRALDPDDHVRGGARAQHRARRSGARSREAAAPPASCSAAR